jgi:type IV secretion system protein VirB6
VVGPVGALCLLTLGRRGLRISQGDPAALHGMWGMIVGIIVVVALSTKVGQFDYYVRDLFYANLPNALNTAVAAHATGEAAATGVKATAAIFDSMWMKSETQVNAVVTAAGMLDVGTTLAAQFCGITVGVALIVMAFWYLMARILLAIVLVFGPIAIACTLHPETTPIFERWMGKVVAMTCLQVSGIVLLTMLLKADQGFMLAVLPNAAAKAVADSGWTGGPEPTTASDLQNLVAMVLFFVMGALALWSLPAVAYSIGTGVAVNTMPHLAALARAAVALLTGVPLTAAIPVGEAAEATSLSMSLAQGELGGASVGTLPASPPPSLASSSTRMIGGPS